MSEPASIRYKNPGAMWDGKTSRKWGSKQHVVLSDGQSNHIAIFPDCVHGAAAQFDLWRTAYTGLTLAGAIRKWSGGNSSSSYMTFLTKNTGIGQADKITADLLSGPKGLALMKAQAQWEAGKPYPMSNEEWMQAQCMVFGTKTAPVESPPTVKHVAAAASATVAGTVAASSGLPWYVVAGAVVVAAVVAFLIFKNRS